MDHKEFDAYVLDLPNTWLEYPFGDGVSAYKVGDPVKREGKLFAIVQDGSSPLRVSLKCDPMLAQALREQYETVLPGYHLNKKHWNTIICSGQLQKEEIFDLVRHSYQLVSPE